MGDRPAFASRESLALALDRGLNVASIEGLDRALYAGADTIMREFERDFYPRSATYTFDVPYDDTSTNTPSWKLYLDPHDLISATTVTVGGVAVTDYQLRPDNRNDSPARWLELDRTGSSSFYSGSASQRRAAIAGLWGWSDRSRSVGVLADDLTADATVLNLARAPVAGVSGVGVGHLLRIGSERMVVEDRLAVDTGDNLAANLPSSASNSIPTSIAVPDGTDYASGEMLAVNGEAMLVQRVLSNTLFVRRGYAGTPVQAHVTGADIYAYRRLQVYRAAVGTTAAVHAAAAPATRWEAPYALEALNIAIAQETAVQEGAAYARTVGSEQNEREARAAGLTAAWKRARSYSRKGGRHYAV